jgi:hypothetical protein
VAEANNTKKWTVMVYMAAGQSHELDTVAVRDLKEMERGIRGNDDVNVVVQINRHWPASVQRYRIKGGEAGSELLVQLEGRTNMGDGVMLAEFLTKVAADESFFADHFCLVLWGHAYGLGFGRDHNDPVHLTELQEALKAFRTARAKSGRKDEPLEILGANACAMSYIEAVYQLRDVAQCMVTSQITVPFVGWPYDTILGRINHTTSPQELAQLIIDAYVHQFDDLPGCDRLEMAAFNLSKAASLKEQVESLAKAIDTDISTFDSAKMSFYRDVFMGAAAGDVRPLIDARRLCDALAGEDGEWASENVKQAAKTFRKILLPRSDQREVLIECQSRHPTLDDLNGLGIFAPFVTDDEVSARLELNDLDADRMVVIRRKNEGRLAYERLDLFKDTGTWPKLVFDRLRRTIPADLMTAIDGVAEMRRGDRADVAQIIMGIESSLNQLARVSDSAKIGIATILKDSRKPKALYAGAGDVEGIAENTGDPSRSFRRPWLKLIPPRVKLENGVLPRTVTKGASAVIGNADVVEASVENLKRVELALAEVERTAKRGFTHARFGLGLMNPGKIGLGGEPPKPGGGAEPPKPGGGGEPPKPGGGAPGAGIAGGDLRTDLGLARVANLFGEVGESLAQLEDALTNVENVTRAMLIPTDEEMPPETWEGKTLEIGRAFELFQEVSEHVRRTVRNVLSHPVYGLGPAEGDLTFDVREELARRGGLSKHRLRLL